LSGLFEQIGDRFGAQLDQVNAVGDTLRDAQAAAAVGCRTHLVCTGKSEGWKGPGVPEGKISVAIAVTLQPTDKTLTDAEIDAVSTRIIAEVQKKTGATLRA
jgi:phenylalanyl-tRNA synthetase beta chain